MHLNDSLKAVLTDLCRQRLLLNGSAAPAPALSVLNKQSVFVKLSFAFWSGLGARDISSCSPKDLLKLADMRDLNIERWSESARACLTFRPVKDVFAIEQYAIIFALLAALQRRADTTMYEMESLGAQFVCLRCSKHGKENVLYDWKGLVRVHYCMPSIVIQRLKLQSYLA